MLDVYKITSTLERLDDASLQQYAAMHKQDPYTLALAVEESNRRKRMRAAPQQSAQPQPPVNEQAIAAMAPAPAPAPQMAGLTQLPAAQMEMADGGIVAFADAGEVQASPFDYLPRFLRERLLGSLTESGILEQQPPKPATPELPGAVDALRYLYQGGKQRLSDFLQRQVEEQRALARGEKPATAAEAAAPAGDTIRASRAGAPSPMQAAPTPALTPRPDAGLPGLAGSGGTRSASTAAAGLGAIPTAPDLPERSSASEKFEQAIKRLPTGESEEVRTARERARDEAVAGLEAAQQKYEAERPQGRPLEGLRTRLEKEESDVGAKREENLKLALVNAGLAMMAGTSQYAFTNIGAGGAQGMKAYREGMKDLDKAAERRQELFAKIEQAERAEQEGRAKDALAARREVVAARSRYNDAKVDFLAKQTDMNRRTAASLAQTETQAEVQRDVAKMQAERALQTALLSARAQLSATNRAVMSQDNATRIASLRELGQNLRKAADEAGEQLKNPQAMWQPDEKARVTKQFNDAMSMLAVINQQLAAASGLKLPEAPPPGAAPPANRPPLGSFQR